MNITRICVLSIAVAMLLSQSQARAQVNNYAAMETAVFQGWNTWDVNSMTSHVLAPEGFEIGLVFNNGSHICQNVTISNTDLLEVGPHAYDGSYTELQIEWYGLEVELQTAVSNGNWVALITPISGTSSSTSFTPTFNMVWGNTGTITNNGSSITATMPAATVKVYCTYSNITNQLFTASSPLGLSTGSSMSLATIQSIISTARTNFINSNNAPFGSDTASATAHSLMQTALAWQVQYDPSNTRVITTVSRVWSADNWGGWVLFDWDSYFNAWMLGMDDKYLAYGNAIAITNEEVASTGGTGFVPNYAAANGTSTNRSQPPVGSLVCWELYRKYQETWFLQTVYPNLLAWNRWWPRNRDANFANGLNNLSGLLCWGSDSLQDAMFESGMDDSPMYGSAVGFNSTTGLMPQYDVGLMGEYISDCKRLAKIAAVLGYPNDQAELLDRAAYYQAHMPQLWNNSAGMFMNQSSTSGTFNTNVSPTCFYAMLAGAATPAEANTMMSTYFYNTSKFWGTWILPSITIDNPDYPNQQYWEGDIWAPLNMLVYLGAQNYDIPQVRNDIAQKSLQLFNSAGVSENYYATNGTRGGQNGYTWGSLLGFISLIQSGYMNAPDSLPYSDSYEVEGENATLTGGAAVATNHTGYSGTGFVDGYYETTTADTKFSVTVAAGGQYALAIRYSAGNGASTNTGLYVNGTLIKNPSFAATTDWNTWANDNEQVVLNSGANTVELKSTASTPACINIDYITVASVPIAASSYNSENSVQTENCIEGGLDVGYISNGSYTEYNSLNLTGKTFFQARVASPSGGSTITIHLDSATGTVIGTAIVPVTGGWQNWANVYCSLSGASGTHNVYLVYTSGMNIEWFVFQASGDSGTGGIPQSGSVYHLICKTSGMALDNNGSTSTGTAVIQQTDTTNDSNQEWELLSLDDGYYNLICQKSGMALDNDNGTTNGNPVVQWTQQSGNTNQEWQLVNLGGGEYNLLCLTDGLALDNEGSTTAGHAVWQWTQQSGNTNQEWSLEFIR